MSDSKDIDSVRIRSWWNKQATTTPASAGMLPLWDGPSFEMLYRQEAEWLHFRRIVPLRKSMRILELGCGAGRWALRIAPLVHEVVAVDFSDEMIRLARERQCSLGLQNVEFRVSAVQDFHWDTAFDVIYLSSMTQYLTDNQLRQTLGQIESMLAPIGIVIDRTSISLGTREAVDDHGYQAIYRTLKEQASIFAEFGFRLTYHAPCYNRMRLPYRFLDKTWFQKGLEAGLQRLARPTVFLINAMTQFVTRVRPTPNRATFRSYGFFRFERETA
jgi:ubiquinone/menaquinone biosynthesis C-methylase UbiE